MCTTWCEFNSALMSKNFRVTPTSEIALSTWSSIAYLHESSLSPLTSPVVDLPRASDPGQPPPVSIVTMPPGVVSHHADKSN